MAEITKFNALMGQATELAIVRDVEPNTKNKGFNVRVKIKYVSIVNPEYQEWIGNVDVVGKFFDTLMEAKQYVDNFAPGVVENIYSTQNGDRGYEREQKMTGAKAVLATGKVTKEYAQQLNETRKGFVTTAQQRADALAGAMGGTI